MVLKPTGCRFDSCHIQHCINDLEEARRSPSHQLPRVASGVSGHGHLIPAVQFGLIERLICNAHQFN